MVQESDVIEVMKKIHDPEIPLDLYNLGLVYGIRVNGDDVEVDLTMTAVGCPAATFLPGEVKSKVEQIPGVKSAKVNVVWQPPWNPNRITPEGRLFLSSFGVNLKYTD
jgi:metal-sulfur cluster biosynthetic enzyme